MLDWSGKIPSFEGGLDFWKQLAATNLKVLSEIRHYYGLNCVTLKIPTLKS